MPARLLAPFLLTTSAALPARAAEPIEVTVLRLATAPRLDGDSADWAAQGAKWQALPSVASFVDSAQDLGESGGFSPAPQVMVGVAGERIHFIVRWQDERADEFYKRWVPRLGKYTRDRRLDDMLALRFHTAGELSDCMLSGRDYTVDVWRWSAGRSQLAGAADDMRHVISKTPMERAAEYPSDFGTIYIRKTMDEGRNGWHNAPRPSTGGDEVMPGVELDGRREGSAADVDAVGKWANGAWTVELSRKLRTGDPEDVDFSAAAPLTWQMAFFNPGYRMQKQITPLLKLKMPK